MHNINNCHDHSQQEAEKNGKFRHLKRDLMLILPCGEYSVCVYQSACTTVYGAALCLV